MSQDSRHVPNRLVTSAVRTGLVVFSSLIAIGAGSPFAMAELPVVLKDQFGSVVRFQGANLPGTTYANRFGGQTLQIDQVDDRAVLHWESFNVSENNEVLFNQPRSSSIALNRVLGNANAPSIINGYITANGRVFIVNHDGILFGENAAVDTRSFLASTLDIDDDIYLNAGFENAVREENGQQPAFFNNPDFVRPMGPITIEAGASIKSDENGRVLMFAPSITNGGRIESAQGQIILAATQDEVYLTPAGEDDDIRGLLVAVKTGGDVTNVGELVAERGNISLMGLAVNQQGVARATSSVSLNGSILLQAQDINREPDSSNIIGQDTTGYTFAPERGGEVVLGGNSTTVVEPEDVTDVLPRLRHIESGIDQALDDERLDQADRDVIDGMVDEFLAGILKRPDQLTEYILYPEQLANALTSRGIPVDASNLGAKIRVTDAGEVRSLLAAAGIQGRAQDFINATAIAGGKQIHIASTAADAQKQAPSDIEIRGESIRFETDSLVAATGGQILVEATSTPNDPRSFSSLTDPNASAAELIVETGAVIDVSGDDTTQVSVARNFVEVEARGNELADAPLQRDGAIRGKTLTVDIREGTDFLNIAGALASIERGVRERLSPGGTLTLKSSGRIDIAAGATLDISGGSVGYAGSQVAPSRLVTANGRVVDIADADPDLVYSGLFADYSIEHEKWGITETWRNASGFYEQGYIEGRDAGVLNLNAPGLVFEGDLLAGSTAGIHQRFAPEDPGSDAPFNVLSRSYNQVPLGGRLTIRHLNSSLQDLVVGEDEGTVPAENGHPLSLSEALVLSPGLLTDGGVSRITIENAGRVMINRPLDLPAFSEMDLLGTQVLVHSDIHTSGGKVTLRASSSLEGLLDDGELGAEFSNARTSLVNITGNIDVSGRWTNDSAAVNAGIPDAAVVTGGGRIDVRSARDLIVSEGSLLDVSGGAYLESDGSFTGGNGGRIHLSSWASEDNSIISRLDLQGELRGFGMDSGGQLVLDAEAVRIESTATNFAASDYALDGRQNFALTTDPASSRNALVIHADALQRGGFQRYGFNALLGGAEVSPHTRIDLIAANTVVDPFGVQAARRSVPGNDSADGNGHPLEMVPTAANLDAFTENRVLPDYERGAVDLALSAGRLGPLQIGSGAAVHADPGAAIELSGQSDVLIDGVISAPAGTIDVLLAGNSGTIQSIQSRIWLGSGARLSAPGAARINTVNNLGLRNGDVLDAGRVRIVADYGSIFGAAGARIDVDAASAKLDIDRNGTLVRKTVGGDAGAIDFSTAESLVFNGELSAQPVAGGRGGQLSVTLDPNRRGAGDPEESNDPFYRSEYVAVLEDYAGLLPGADEDVGAELIGHAYLPMGQLNAGGFDSLEVIVRGPGTLAPDTAESLPVIEYSRDTRLSMARRIVLDAAVIRASGDADLLLNAPYVALGSSEDAFHLDGSEITAEKIAPGQFEPTDEILELVSSPGDGGLRVEADLIELVGELATEGIGRAGERLQADATLAGRAGVEFVAQQDLRLRGVRLDASNSTRYEGLFRSAGDVQILAERVYPVTLTDFELEVEGVDGSIEFGSLSGASVEYPLSIGGGLAVHADHVHQGGNILAPLGRLEFNAAERLQISAGSLTSSSGFGVEAPFFVTQPGGDLILPGSGNKGDLVFVEKESASVAFDRALPEQLVLLDSPNVDVQPGAEFDLRGGTDARATEFIPGPGGSRDILLADLDPDAGMDPNSAFAILPGLSGFAPFDPLLTPRSRSAQGIAVGDTVVLEEGIKGLPAGEYAMLPPRYALFGGYLVAPVAGTRDLVPGADVSAPDGSVVLAGRFGVAGSDAVDSRSQGFSIIDGQTVRTRAEFLETPLADAYNGGNTRSPEDAGTLSIEAQSSLQLAGRLVQGGSEAGRGSQVDIVADVISILQRSNGGGIELKVGQLEQLGADSLLIGARRHSSPDGQVIEAISSEINVIAGTSLDVPELILVAENIDVQSSASQTTLLRSTATAAGEEERLIIAGDPASGINGDAAVLAVSNRTLTMERAAPTGADTGRLVLSPDATLEANGSVLADVAGAIVFTGGIRAEGALVNLGATTVSLGETNNQPIASGLILSNDVLTGLAGSRLRLRSDNTIDIYGRLLDTTDNGVLSFADLDLDGRGLVGKFDAGADVQLVAGSIRLSNSTGAEAGSVSAAGGSSGLLIAADSIDLGDGSFSIQGYDPVSVQAQQAILAAGEGELIAAGGLQIEAPIIAGAAGADYTFTARDSALTVSGADALAALPGGAGLAATLQLQGASVDFAGRVVLPSGHVRIHQAGDASSPVAGDDLVIRPEAIIDVAGITREFGPETVYTGGGGIHVLADTGAIEVADGSLFDVSAGAAAGEAGEIRLDAPNGPLRMSSAASLIAEGSGGDFLLDADTLGVGGVADGHAYSELSRLLGGGFSDRRAVRLRSQGIVHEESLTVHAHEIRLVSDSESIEIRGTIDASGQGLNTVRENGGRIVLAAGDAVDIESSAELLATATQDDDGVPLESLRGGRVEFFALDADNDDPGALRDRVNLQAGSLIDVSGGENPVFTADEYVVTAPEVLDGEVLVHTRLIDAGSGSFVQGALDATVVGAAASDLVVTSRTSVADGVVDAADIEARYADTTTFMQNTVAAADGFRVVPGLLIESDGDLVLRDPWNLYGPDTSGGWHFGETSTDPGVTGHIVLRAAGDLTLQSKLTDSYYVDKGILSAGIPDLVDRLDRSAESWSYTLTAGADLASADLSAVDPGTGDLVMRSDMEAFLEARAIEIREESLANPFFAVKDPTFDAPTPGSFFGDDLDLEPADLQNLGLVTDADFTVTVRTGTGDIALYAGNDILFDSSTLSTADGAEFHSSAAVYTGGQDRGLSQNMLDAMPGFDTGIFSDARTVNKWMGGGAIFPVNGGDVTVHASGSIISNRLPDLPSEWQPRIGEPSAVSNEVITRITTEAGAVPTHWGIAFSRFIGIGALGGGELDVRSGGDLNNLALAVPTTGRTIDGAETDASGKFIEALETTEVAGGGILTVDVTGDANNGLFYLGDGVAGISVRGDSGSAAAGSRTDVYAGFDARYTLTAGGELNITEVQDPGTVPLSDSQGSLTGIAPGSTRRFAPYYDNVFFTYSDAAQIDLQALSGDLAVSGTGGVVNSVAPVYRMISHSGDLVIGEDIFQYPSAQGQLEIMAGRSLDVQTGTGSGGIVRLVQSDQEAALLAGIQNPVQKPVLPHAEQPVHAGDDQPSLIIADKGSISTSGRSIWSVTLAEAVHMQAGLDIINVSADVQNNQPGDVTSFIAGRDIRQLTQRDTDGTFRVFSEAESQQVSRFVISGPGTAEFIAGSSINLGTSDGIESVGNIANRFLPEQGADLVLLAGIGEEPDIDSFITTYFTERVVPLSVIQVDTIDGVPMTGPDGAALYSAGLDFYTDGANGNLVSVPRPDGVNALSEIAGERVTRNEKVDYRMLLSDYFSEMGLAANEAAVSDFQLLSERNQRSLLADVLFAEVRGSGTFAEQSGTADYSRGFDAINSLFPQTDPDGGISMLLSQVQTLDGGDIDIIVPGGLINAGAASSDIIDKGAADLGIVAAQAGDVNVMVDQDLLVNSTRVFALQGDLTIWSSNGDIDAGKGAKTVTSVPDPVTRIGPTGETVIEFPPAVQGSGLQGVNAYLFAPKGVINAGDAGIRVIGNLTLGATAVIGADNIDVGGISVGVPTAAAGVGAGIANAGDATNSATNVARETTDLDNEEEAGSTTLGILSVNVEGFGDCPAGDPLCKK